MSSKHEFYLFRKSGFGCLLFGIMLHGIIFFLLLCLGNGLCLMSSDPSSFAPAVSMACYLCSALFSSIIMAKRAEGGKVWYAVLTAFVFVLLLLLFGVIFEKGTLPLSVLAQHTAYVMTALLGGILGSKKNKKRHHG